MKYCNKTKEIIRSSYKSCSAEDIQELIQDLGLTYRTVINLKKYINKLVQHDILKEERRQKFERWALSDPIKYRAKTLLAGARARAKAKNIPCDLTVQWIEDKLRMGKCEITEIDFVIKEYSKAEEYIQVHPHAPSLDQIKPSGGYTMNNVQVVVDHFNKMKNDRDLETTVYLARRLVEAHDRRKINLLTY